MNRREFIALAGAAATWPFVARAQQVGRMRQIGFLFPNSGGDPEWERRVEALTDALRTLGWIEGKTVKFTVRYAEGKPERLSAFAAELVSAKVDVIVTQGSEPIKALAQYQQHDSNCHGADRRCRGYGCYRQPGPSWRERNRYDAGRKRNGCRRDYSS